MPLLTTSKLPSGRYTLQAAVNRCKSPLRLSWQNLQPPVSPPVLEHSKTQPHLRRHKRASKRQWPRDVAGPGADETRALRFLPAK